MSRLSVKQSLTAQEELKILDKRAEQLWEGYKEHKEAYYLLMLKKIAYKQETLSAKTKFEE